MLPRRRLARAGLAILSLLLFGTLSLHFIEGIGLFDAFFQTVVTIATAGIESGQVTSIAGKLTTLALLVAGAGILVFTAGSIVQAALEFELSDYFGERRMRRQIDQLRDHFIICGAGRVGLEVAADLAERTLPFVIVDQTPEIVARVVQLGYLVVQGDATVDETLIAAGVRHARCLLAASDSDVNNTYITLSAKALNNGIFVVVRSSRIDIDSKLRQAGADRVICPYSTAGRQMALAAIQPLIGEVLVAPGRPQDSVLAQLPIAQGSALIGRTIGDMLVGRGDLTVLGLRRGSGEILVGPASECILRGGDELFLLGPEAALARIHPQSSAGRAGNATDVRSP